MHKTRLFLLDARKPHPPTAFEANGLLAERLRSGLWFHEPLSAKAYQGSMAGWFTPILIQELAGLSEGGNDRSGRARLDPRFTGSAGSRWRAAMKEAAN
jgi:hypothetical protein